jgi:acyl transferase domain-containing protein
VLQLGLVALWRSWGIEPSAVVGHSMGEIIAASAAGAFDRVAALELLLQRAELTEQGARGGRMLSIALPASQVAPLLAGIKSRIGISAVNGPRSTVVSGDPDAVTWIEEQGARLGLATRRLPVNYAFHSPLLDGFADKIAAVAPQPTRKRKIAFYSTVTGTLAAVENLDCHHWVRNLRDQVEFYPAVQRMIHDGITTFVEIGPHPSLLRNVREIIEELGGNGLVVGSLRRDQPSWASLYRSLGELYQAGFDIPWEAVNAAPAARCKLPTYPWQRTRHWLTLTDRPATPAFPDSGVLASPGFDLVDAVPPDAVDADFANVVLNYVRGRVAEVQGLATADEVPIDQRLNELDSIVIVELKNQIEGEFGITVPLRTLLAGDTPLLLANAIVEFANNRVRSGKL